MYLGLTDYYKEKAGPMRRFICCLRRFLCSIEQIELIIIQYYYINFYYFNFKAT